jgi:glutamate 2,3-aminomutase
VPTASNSNEKEMMTMVLNVKQENRKKAIEKGKELKNYIQEYLDVRESIPVGLKLNEELGRNKKRILDLLGGNEEDWKDWQWHMKNTITETSQLKELFGLSREEIEDIEKVEKIYRWAISPYYASLIDASDRNCPAWIQSIPSVNELEPNPEGYAPLISDYRSPAPLVSRIYPDRVIINLTNRCIVFCRHCMRREDIKDRDYIYQKELIQAALEYIKKTEEIRDVLLTGGDPLTLPDNMLDWVLSELDAIPHVEMKRIGTRIPVTLPQRITEELCKMLEKHDPLYINTQFNHPREISEDSKKACLMLAKAGIPLGNQTVLLKGINNDIHVMKKLVHELLKIKVKPYYIYHCKNVPGITHLRPPIEDGIEIIKNLRGFTTGLAVPTFVVPSLRGKIPLNPESIIDMNHPDGILLRAWNGEEVLYK